MTASMLLGSMFRARNATGADAPQSIRTVRPFVAKWKHVLWRPPEPNASPEPMMVSRMSGRCTGPLADLPMPAAQIAEFLRHDQFGRAHEVDRHERRDVGDGIVIARDEHAILQLAVEQREKLEHARAVRLAPFRDLRLHVLHRRMQVAKHRRDGLIEIEFDAPVPHLDQRLLHRTAAEQRRVPADRESARLNSRHPVNSYALFRLDKKKRSAVRL